MFSPKCNVINILEKGINKLQHGSLAVHDLTSGFEKDHQRGQGAWQKQNTADAGCCASIAVVTFAAVDFTLRGSTGGFTSRVGFLITVSIGSAHSSERFSWANFQVGFNTLIGQRSHAGRTFSFAFIPRLATGAGHALQTHNWKHTWQGMLR